MGQESDFDATLGARSYRVGQDRAGRWLAVELMGRGGGMFVTREAAMRFARIETSYRPGAVIVASEPVWFRLTRLHHPAFGRRRCPRAAA